MAEIITKDRKEYNIWDKINSKWNRLNFLTNAKSVDFDDGKTAQNKLGAIDGITSDLSGESETVAASIKCVNQLNSSLGGLNFAQDAEGNWGYIPSGADSVIPFKSNNFGNFDITGWTITKDENAVGDISSNGIWFYAKTNSNCGICIYKSIDLTNVNSITIKTLNTSDFFTYYLKKDKPNPGSYGSTATAIDYGWAETVIDTSALTGVYYFGICNAFRTVFSFLYDFVLN